MIGISLFPAVCIEFFGSALAIIFSCLSCYYAFKLSRRDPNNFIWGFLWYFTIAITIFCFSRGVGHIVRIILDVTGYTDEWKILSPWSGGLNTLLLISVSAVIIYYHKGLEAYKAIGEKASKLKVVADELQTLNSKLEDRVEERTEELAASERRFRSIFENSKDIVYVTDDINKITHINASGKELFADKVTGKYILFPEIFSDPKEWVRFKEILEKQGYVEDFETSCMTSNGQKSTILFSVNAIHNLYGEVIGHEGIGKDTTRLNLMTEKLMDQEKMASVGQMAAGVAHEINTPLGIILGYSQLMLDDEEEIQEAAYLEIIERQAKICQKIVADLLKFSRQSESVIQFVNINELIQDVLSVTGHTLSINRVEVHLDLQEMLPLVYADSERIQQVFINLINNAHFALGEEGGEITISTKEHSDKVEIIVEDTGCGIPEDVQKKIFDPFFTTKDVGEGTGLGLSVVYGIIVEFGGTINVVSPVPGMKEEKGRPGTAFSMLLPIGEDQ